MNRNRSVSVGSVLVLTGWLGACAVPAAASPLLACLAPGDARASAPPAWAPANGVRRKEASRYRYYPGQQVYFDTSSQVWFYMNLSTGVWLSGPRLPVTIVIGPASFVELDMTTNRPYLHHSEVTVRYPRKAGKSAVSGDKGTSGGKSDSGGHEKKQEHGGGKGHR